MMNCPYAYLAVLASLALAGCSTRNPLFGISSASDSGGSSGGAESTGAPPTSGPATSTTLPETDGSATDGTATDGTATATATSMTSMTSLTDTTDSSQTATSVDPETGGSTDVGTDTGSSSSDGDGPGSSSSGGVCGDGLEDGAEQCDDGNQIDEDSCTNQCMDAICGDGLVQMDEEQCDDGVDNGVDKACLGNCEQNICGDGNPGPDETCDDGPDNGALGKCSEDCSTMIPDETLLIKVLTVNNLPLILAGNFNGNTGIAGGDTLCEGLGEFKILASDGVLGSRVATLNQYEGDGQKDWVLAPHRGYANVKGELVFVTGGEALLGVRKQAPVPLLKPIGAPGQIVWTGLNKSWTASDANCKKWTSNEIQATGGTGMASKLDGTFVANGAKLCSTPLAIYCVQQPG